MSHSKMLKTRRSRQRRRKELAGIAKRAKKLRKQQAKVDEPQISIGASPVEFRAQGD